MKKTKSSLKKWLAKKRRLTQKWLTVQKKSDKYENELMDLKARRLKMVM